MENISEIKGKRGRPPKMLYTGVTKNEMMSMYGNVGLFDEVKSERGKVNLCYMIHAHEALQDNNDDCPINGEFAFIISAVGSDVKEYKRTILQELGRLEDDDLIRAVAGEVCKSKMSTRRAIIYIRQFRSEKKKGETLQLANEIIKILNDYDMKHSNVDYFLMLEALDVVRNIIMENISENN
jgi:hypothetical protein